MNLEKKPKEKNIRSSIWWWKPVILAPLEVVIRRIGLRPQQKVCKCPYQPMAGHWVLACHLSFSGKHKWDHDPNLPRYKARLYLKNN
jgi:hypothetical protein